MKNTALLAPMFALAGWTFCVLLNVAITRLRSKVHPKDFRYGEADTVPDNVKLANRNYMNLLELPMLFYVVCLVIVVAGVSNAWLPCLAWAYVALRVVHSVVHLTYNNVLHRFVVFGLSNFALIGMWMVTGWALFA